MMSDFEVFLEPGERLVLEDGLVILQDALTALEVIGQKLFALKRLAVLAANPGCDPVERISLNLCFRQLKKELDDWAQISSGGIRILQGSLNCGANMEESSR